MMSFFEAGEEAAKHELVRKHDVKQDHSYKVILA
jgi:hypothetical protein